MLWFGSINRHFYLLIRNPENLRAQECEKWGFERCHFCPKEAVRTCFSSPYPQRFHDLRWQCKFPRLFQLHQGSSATKTLQKWADGKKMSKRIIGTGAKLMALHRPAYRPVKHAQEKIPESKVLSYKIKNWKIPAHTFTASSAALQAMTVASISPVCPTMSLFGRLTRTYSNMWTDTLTSQHKIKLRYPDDKWKVDCIPDGIFG